MTRIDAISEKEREELKKEIKQEIRHEDLRKKLIGCGGCLLFAIILLGIPSAYVLAQLAKSGFVDVPVMSRAMYKPLPPTRIVLPLYGSKPEDVYRVIATKVKYEPQSGFAKLPVTEAEITTVVQGAIVTAPPDMLPFPIRSAQVAIDDESVEIYAISPQKNRDATVRIRFRPYVKGGELRAEVHEVSLGSLTLNKKVGEFLFNAFGSIVVGATSDALDDLGSLVNVELDPGTIRFIVVPNVR